jgi:two-component system, NarL family, invasion response regulator UvrY
VTAVSSVVRVLVADDQVPFRRAARTVLGATPGFEMVGEAASGEEAVELAALLEPDLVLIDIHMPGMGGFEASRRIAGWQSGPVTVLVSTYRSEDLPENPRSCGAVAYVHKEDFGPRTLRTLWEGAASPLPRPGRGARP